MHTYDQVLEPSAGPTFKTVAAASLTIHAFPLTTQKSRKSNNVLPAIRDQIVQDGIRFLAMIGSWVESEFLGLRQFIESGNAMAAICGFSRPDVC